MPTINQLVRKGRKSATTKSTSPALQHGYNSMKKKMTNKRAPQKRGVCTVVNKLFNIVQPDRAYFGQKDAQQLAIIMRMVTDLNMDIEIVGCPIIREADGLAKSSRNIYLKPEERQAAVVLSKSVKLGQKMIEDGERDAKKIVAAMKDLIGSEPLADIDYVEMVDMDTMKSIDIVEGHVLCAMAVRFGKARLIDNFILDMNK